MPLCKFASHFYSPKNKDAQIHFETESTKMKSMDFVIVYCLHCSNIGHILVSNTKMRHLSKGRSVKILYILTLRPLER